MAKGHNPRRAKTHWSYTVAEAATLFSVHRNTVRNWIKRGLPTVKSGGLVLVLGHELRGFLEKEASARKSRCAAGQLYCLRCRAPQQPAPGSAKFVSTTGKSGNLGAVCGGCGSRMFRRIALSKLTEAGFACVPVEARGHAPSREPLPLPELSSPLDLPGPCENTTLKTSA